MLAATTYATGYCLGKSVEINPKFHDQLMKASTKHKKQKKTALPSLGALVPQRFPKATPTFKAQELFPFFRQSTSQRSTKPLLALFLSKIEHKLDFARSKTNICEGVDG